MEATTAKLFSMFAPLKTNASNLNQGMPFAMKRFIILIWMLISTTLLVAQDIHFSQFYMSPLNLNPALTGVMNCNVRFTGNYRSQWASILKENAYKTYSFSYDQRIPVGRYDNFGIGATLWGDVAGTLNYGTTTAKLSTSYAKRLGGDLHKSHYLVAGVEGGIAQRRVNLANAQWGSQHSSDNPGTFDPNLPSGEFIDNENFMFPDFSAGLLWFSVLNERSNWNAGVAMSHLNNPNQSFYNDRFESLFTKYTFHAGGEFMTSARFGLSPNLVYFQQGPHRQINFGTYLKFRLGKSQFNYQTFQIGPWMRFAQTLNNFLEPESIILAARFDYNEFTIGISYDANISRLRPATNGNGGFELSIQYKICRTDRRGVYCPANF